MNSGLTSVVVRCARRSVHLAAAAVLATTAPAVAQNAKVYVANSANSRIYSVQFNPPSLVQVNTDPNQLVKIRDLAIRDNGLGGQGLIVCDRNAGRVVIYPNASGASQVIFNKDLMAGPDRPDGLSLDLAGNIFVMNSGQGNSGGAASQVWVIRRDLACGGGPGCLPGGYRAPLGLIDGNVQVLTVVNNVPTLIAAQSLFESLVVRTNAGTSRAGDLLVLTTPGAMIRYKAADISAFLAVLAAGQVPAPLTPETIIHPAGASVPLDRQFPAGAVPNGLAVGPDGNLLIVVGDGRVLIYSPDGRRRSNGAGGFVDFTSGIGSDEFKISTCLQDGKNRVFITSQARGETRRYSVQANGTGVLDGIVSGFQFPVGVDASNATVVPAPAGNNINIASNTVLTSQVEQVTLAGLVNARIATFADPREAEQSIPAHLPLHRSLFLDELRADLPHTEIPAWVRAFRLGNPTTGVPSFILIEAEATAVVSGLIDHLAEENPILGYNPNCTDPDTTKQPFLFWAPDANDLPILEGNRFIDVSTGCGSVRGLTRDMSYFLAGVRVCQPLTTLSSQKLTSLRTVCNAACISAQLKEDLNQILDRIQRDFDRRRYTRAIQGLQELEAEVVANPQGFVNCTANNAAEIRARARSLIWALGKL